MLLKETDGGWRNAGEWQEKLESAEREWAAKLSDADERSVMAVAEIKAEMHKTLQDKDETIEILRQKLRSLEATS